MSKSESYSKLNKLKNNIFSITDVVEIHIKYEKLESVKYSEEISWKDLIASNFLDDLETIILAGPLWKFNPTCLYLFIKDDVFSYDRKALEKSVLTEGHIEEQEVDRNLNLYTLVYPVEVLLLNVYDIDEKYIENSEYIAVNTLVGKIVL